MAVKVLLAWVRERRVPPAAAPDRAANSRCGGAIPRGRLRGPARGGRPRLRRAACRDINRPRQRVADRGGRRTEAAPEGN
eukprot:scaffold33518_cov73-Isochrysis_galbana.AAC.1